MTFREEVFFFFGDFVETIVSGDCLMLRHSTVDFPMIVIH